MLHEMCAMTPEARTTNASLHMNVCSPLLSHPENKRPCYAVCVVGQPFSVAFPLNQNVPLTNTLIMQMPQSDLMSTMTICSREALAGPITWIIGFGVKGFHMLKNMR